MSEGFSSAMRACPVHYGGSPVLRVPTTDVNGLDIKILVTNSTGESRSSVGLKFHDDIVGTSRCAISDGHL